MKNGKIIVSGDDFGGYPWKQEFHIYENYIAVHFHSFTSKPEIADMATRSRKIKDIWYVAMETIVLKSALIKTISSDELMQAFELNMENIKR